MVQTTSIHEQILVWSATGRAPDGCGPWPDQAEIVALLVGHRVVGRALATARERRPAWLSDAALAALEAEQQGIRAAFDEHVTALRAFADAYLGADAPAVLLKGYSAHLAGHLAGRAASTLRRTLDLDLVCARPAPVLDAVRRGDAEEYRSPSPHELVNARICGADIDLHGHYPVWSYEVDVPTHAGPPGEGRIAYHSGRLHVSPLEVSHLLEGALPCAVLGTPCLRIPDPAAMILIHSAHCYRNAVSRSSVSVREKPPIRFVELVEIRDLLGHPSFAPARLVALARETRAQATLALAGTLLETLFDDARLSTLAAEAGAGTGSGTPISIWGGFWGDLRYDAGTLLTRHADTASVVAALQGTRIARADGETLRIAPIDHRSTPALACDVTLHAFRDAAATSRAHVALTRTGETLVFELDVTPLTDAINQRVALDVAGFAFELNWNRETDRVNWKQSERAVTPQVEWRRTDEGFAARITLTRADDPILQGNELPILIGVGEFERVHAMRAGLLIPLVLCGRYAGIRHADA